MIDLDDMQDVYRDLLDYIQQTRDLYTHDRIKLYRGKEVSPETYEIIKNIVLGELDGFTILIKKRMSQVDFIDKYEKEHEA